MAKEAPLRNICERGAISMLSIINFQDLLILQSTPEAVVGGSWAYFTHFS